MKCSKPKNLKEIIMRKLQNFRSKQVEIEMIMADIQKQYSRVKELTAEAELEATFLDFCIDTVVHVTKVSFTQMKGRCRKNHIHLPRMMLVMCLNRELTLQEIGNQLDGRDHSSIHNCKVKHYQLMQTHEWYQETFQKIETIIDQHLTQIRA
jgi:chromosomal replication initiation ATPase DnaA